MIVASGCHPIFFAPEEKLLILKKLLKGTAISHKFTLKKYQRLKSRKMIHQLFESGKSFNESVFRVLYADGNKEILQVGISVSKRRFKNAVDRNRIKRLVREAWRLNAPPLRELLDKDAASLVVFIIYNGKEIPPFSEVEAAIKAILKRLINRFSPRLQT